eukprot:6211862-Pleurochrysis_carterae.AAC.1
MPACQSKARCEGKLVHPPTLVRDGRVQAGQTPRTRHFERSAQKRTTYAACGEQQPPNRERASSTVPKTHTQRHEPALCATSTRRTPTAQDVHLPTCLQLVFSQLAHPISS